MLLVFFVSRGTTPSNGIEYKDIISLLLTAITVVLAALAIGIAVLAIWGYNSIRESAERAAGDVAERTAKEVADQTAREVATTVALRSSEDMMSHMKRNLGVEATQETEDRLSEALSEKGGANDSSGN
jgi:hypothetical protein